MKSCLLMLVMVLQFSIGFGQFHSKPEYTVPSKKNALLKTLIAPVTLVGLGLYATTNNTILNKIEVREERNEWMPNFNHHADDYLQYAPIVAVYGLSLAGVKAENDFANRTWPFLFFL
jgi:hypothetical protein